MDRAENLTRIRLRNQPVSFAVQYRYEILSLDDDFHRQDLGFFLGGSNVNGSGGITPSTDVFLENGLTDYHVHVFRLLAKIRL